MNPQFKPGQVCEQSGIYAIVDAEGVATGEERVVTRGEPFPPTPVKGQMYQLSRLAGLPSESAPSPTEEVQTISRTGARRQQMPSATSDTQGQIDRRIVDASLRHAQIKSYVSLILSIIFFIAGLYFVWSTTSIFTELRQNGIEFFQQSEEALRLLQGVAADLRDDYTSGETVAEAILRLDLMFIQGPLATVGTTLLRLAGMTTTGIMLLIVGALLLRRRTIEIEMEDMGSLAQRVRSGLGQVKAVEELIQAVFGQSRSAWTLRLWAARILLYVGVIILGFAVMQVFFPGLFPGVDKAVMFGTGAAASLLSTVLSIFLNPARQLQQGLTDNALLELTIVSFAKQTALVEGWMARALLSVKEDDDWGPEQRVFQSLQSNAAMMGSALEQSMSLLKLYATPQDALAGDEGRKQLINDVLRAQALKAGLDIVPKRIFLEFGQQQTFTVFPRYQSVTWQVSGPLSNNGQLEQTIGASTIYVAPPKGEDTPAGTVITIKAQLNQAHTATAQVTLIEWFDIQGADQVTIGGEETAYTVDPAVQVIWSVTPENVGTITAEGKYTPPATIEGDTESVTIQAKLVGAPDFVRSKTVKLIEAASS